MRKRIISFFLILLVFMNYMPVNTIMAAKKPTKLTLNCKSADSYVGGTVKLKVVSGQPKVEWETSNKKIAVVSNKGVVKAKKAGKVTVTARLKAEPKTVAKCSIRVYKATKDIRLLSEKDYTLEIGQEQTLKAEVAKPAKGAQPVRWKSGNSKIARVTDKGRVTALSVGTVKVTGQSGGKKAAVTVTVVEKASGGTGIPGSPNPADPEEPSVIPVSSPVLDNPDPNHPVSSAGPVPSDNPMPSVGPSASDGPEGISRGEWVSELVKRLGYSVEKENLAVNLATGDVLYKYDDIDGDSHAMEIEAAYSYNILPPVETEMGEPCLFQPDAPVTREFAALTAVRGLGFASEAALVSSDSSMLAYPGEDKLAVDFGMLSLKGDKFLPEDILSEEEKSEVLGVVDRILQEREITSGQKDEIVYTDAENITDWTERAVGYTLLPAGEEGAFELSVPDSADTASLQEGNIIKLPASKDYPAGIFLKVSKKEASGDGTGRITGEIPDISEVFRSVAMEGCAGAFLDGIVPEEGVSFSVQEQESGEAVRSRRMSSRLGVSSSGIRDDGLGCSVKVTVKNGAINMTAGGLGSELEKDVETGENTVIDKDLESSFELQIPNIRYNIDMQFHNPFAAPQINKLYIEVPNSVTLTSSIAKELSGEKKLGTVPVPLAGGFCVKLGIYLTYGAGGNITISYALEGALGIQYVDGKLANISRYAGTGDIEAKAEAWLGLKPEISLNWVAVELYNIQPEIGVKADVTTHVHDAGASTALTCTDVRLWAYFNFSAGKGSFIGDLLQDLCIDARAIYDESNSPFRKNPFCHIENGKKVEECTYGKGTVKGGVRDTDGRALAGCAVIISTESQAVSRVQTEADGSFSVELPAGSYMVTCYKKDYESVANAVELAPQGEESLSVELTPKGEESLWPVLEGTLSGEFCGISWKIDENRMLTLEGECSRRFSWDEVPWYKNKDGIKSAKVSVIGLDNMGRMFGDYGKLERVDFTGTDTSQVTFMLGMFEGCESLTSLDLGNFDTGNVTNMMDMFCRCKNLTSLDLRNFDTGNVTDMYCMFSNCKNLISLDLGNFDTRNVTDMYAMFSGCESLTSLDLRNFDTGNVTDMRWMFDNCYNLTSLDLRNFDTGNVTSMYSMFNYCESLTGLDLGNFDTRNVIYMDHMFSQCKSLTSLNLRNFDTGNVKYMQGMFAGCYNLTSLDLGNFDTGNVIDMGWMFCQCYNLTSLDLGNFDTGNVKYMDSMFSHCESLTSLNISSFNISKVSVLDNMFFHGCANLKTILFPAGWPSDIVPYYEPWVDIE